MLAQAQKNGCDGRHEDSPRCHFSPVEKNPSQLRNNLFRLLIFPRAWLERIIH
jgi:hypothetical protein